MIVWLKHFRQISPLKLETSLSCHRTWFRTLVQCASFQNEVASKVLSWAWSSIMVGVSHFVLMLLAIKPIARYLACYFQSLWSCLSHSHTAIFQSLSSSCTIIASIQSWTCMGCSVAKTWGYISHFHRLQTHTTTWDAQDIQFWKTSDILKELDSYQ